MHAIRQETLGEPEVLALRDVPRPDPGPTEVLVRVAAAGVNPVDCKIRARGGFLGDPPAVHGSRRPRSTRASASWWSALAAGSDT